MLTFSQPQCLRESLKETYQYLLDRLLPVVTYPVSLVQRSEGADSAEAAHGVALPGPKNEDLALTLVASNEFQEDRFARKVQGRFISLCKKLASSCATSWDLKAELVRQEQYHLDDLILSLFQSGNRKYVLLDTLRFLREALLARYEGGQVQNTVLVSWNRSKLLSRLHSQECALIPFRKPVDLAHGLRNDPGLMMLSDGNSCILLMDGNTCCTTHWCSLPTNPVGVPLGWEMVPRRYHRLSELIQGRDVVLGVDGRQIWLFTSAEVLRWNPKGWHRVSDAGLRQRVSEHLEERFVNKLLGLATQISREDRGALFLITDDTEGFLKMCSSGLRRTLGDQRLLSLEDAPLEALVRLTTLDGCVVFNRRGDLVDGGVLLSLPPESRVEGRGAGTTAARAASRFGLSLKISHDGPVWFFENGELIRRVG